MTQYLPELLPFAVMVAVFAVAAFACRLPVSLSLAAAAVAGAAAGGEGFALRHLVEGTVGYLDAMLTIATAMIFMRLIRASGLLDTLAHHLVLALERRPASLLVVMTLFAMSGGMITGSSTATVLTTGAIVAPVFLGIGIPRERTGALIAMAGILGMVAPPVNIPVMLIGAGVDMPYRGFGLPLLVLTVPLAVAIAILLGGKSVRASRVDRSALPPSSHGEYGWKLYAPLALLLALIVAERALPRIVPPLGMPLIFVLSSLPAPFTGRKMNAALVARGAVRSALPVLSVLAGVGMFLQVMTLTGGRGLLVSLLTAVPPALLYPSIGVSMPLFGAVSAFGSASILGVPFLLALLGRNDVVVASALSLVAAMGDLIPPAALAGRFASKVVREPRYGRVLALCAVPALLCVGASLGFIATAGFWGRFLFWKNHAALYAVLLAAVAACAAAVLLLDRAWRPRAEKAA